MYLQMCMPNWEPGCVRKHAYCCCQSAVEVLNAMFCAYLAEVQVTELQLLFPPRNIFLNQKRLLKNECEVF